MSAGDDAASDVAGLMESINSHLARMKTPEQYVAAVAVLIGAGVGLAIGTGSSEMEVRSKMSELIDAMMAVHKANMPVTSGGSA